MGLSSRKESWHILQYFGKVKVGEGEVLGKNQHAPVLCQARCTVVNKQTWSLPSWNLSPNVAHIQSKQGSKSIATDCESESVVLRENKRKTCVRPRSGKDPFKEGTLNL